MADNEIHDLAAGLIESEPLMVIGRTIASGGQKVQEAWDTIQSHLSSLASKAKPAAESAINSVSQALTPTVQAQAVQPAPAEAKAASGPTWTAQQFAQQIKTQYPEYKDWSDQELVSAIFEKYPEYKDQVETPTDQNWRQAVGKGQVIFSNKVLAGARENLPAIGGTVGQVAGSAAGRPVGGVLGAGVGGMVGERGRQYARAATGVEPLPEQLDAAGRVLKAGAAQGALAAGGEMLAKGLDTLGKSVYRSVLKPSLSEANIGNADQIIEDAFKESLPISRGGSGQARQLISQLKSKVTAIQDASPNKTDVHAVADELRQFATKQYFKPGVPSADFDAAMKVADNIDKHASLAQTVMKPVQRTVDTGIVDASGQPVKRTVTEMKPTTVYRRAVSQNEAQGIKEGLQKTGADASLLDSAATKQASEAGGHYMRVAMEKATPGIAPLNARESKLIDVAEAINRAVQREANQYKTIQGTRGAIGAAVGLEEGKRTGDPWSAMVKGMAVTLALQPQVVSRAALVASRLGRMSGIAPASAARLAIAAVQSQSEEGQ